LFRRPEAFNAFCAKLEKSPHANGIAFFLSLFLLPAAMSPQSPQAKFFLGFDRNDYPGDAP